MKDVAQREAVLLGQRDVETVVGGGRLQLKVEAAAKALAQSQAPGFVDASTEWRVDHQLHPATLVEEPLGDHRGLRGHSAQNRATLHDIFNGLLGAGVVEATFILQPGHCGSYVRLCRRKSHGRRMRQHLADLLPQPSNMLGQFFRPCRSFSTPERNGRWRTVRVLH